LYSGSASQVSDFILAITHLISAKPSIRFASHVLKNLHLHESGDLPGRIQRRDHLHRRFLRPFRPSRGGSCVASAMPSDRRPPVPSAAAVRAHLFCRVPQGIYRPEPLAQRRVAAVYDRADGQQHLLSAYALVDVLGAYLVEIPVAAFCTRRAFRLAYFEQVISAGVIRRKPLLKLKYVHARSPRAPGGALRGGAPQRGQRKTRAAGLERGGRPPPLPQKNTASPSYSSSRANAPFQTPSISSTETSTTFAPLQ